MSVEEEKAARRARAQRLKDALDADASPGVLSGSMTVLLFLMANDVPERDCLGEVMAGSCLGGRGDAP